MTEAAQLAFLSRLDGTATPPDTLFIFTANDLDKLEKRFISRCRKLTIAIPSDLEIADYLADVWAAETGAPGIDFMTVAREADGNIRSALNALETDLLIVGDGDEPTPPPKQSQVARMPAHASRQATESEDESNLAELQRLLDACA